MKELASALSNRLEDLTIEYFQYLSEIPDYQHFKKGLVYVIVRDDIELTISCLEKNDGDPFIKSVQSKSQERLHKGFSLEGLLQALDGLESTILPHVTDIEDAKFLWQMFSEARSTVSIQAEQTIRDRENQLRAVLETSPIPTLISRLPDGMTLFVNSRLSEMFGISPDQASGHQFQDLFYDNGEAKKLLERLQDDKPLQDYEVRLNKTDGSFIWTSLSAKPLTFDGQTALLTGIVDITEYKRLEDVESDLVEYDGHQQEQVKALVAQEIAAATELGELFKRVVISVKELAGYYHTQILGYDSDLGAFVLIDGYGKIGEEMLKAKYQIPVGEGVVGKAGVAGKTVLRPNLAEDPDWEPDPLIPNTKAQIAVPIRLGEEVLGVLDVHGDVVGSLGVEDQLLLEGLCDQIATAIDKIWLYEDAQKKLKEQTILREATSMFLTTLDQEQLLNYLTEQIALAVDATSAYISSFNAKEKTSTVIAEHIGPAANTKEKISDLGETYVEPWFDMEALAKAGNVETIHADDPDAPVEMREYMQKFGAKSALNIPLAVEDRVVGYVKVWESRRRREFTKDEVELCRSLSGQAAIALENARLYASSQETAARVEALVEERTAELQAAEQSLRETLDRRGYQVQVSTQIAQEIAAAPGLEAIFERVVTLVKEQFGYYYAQILRYDPSLDAVALTYGYGEIGETMLAAGHQMPLGEGLIGTAAARGITVLRPGLVEDPDWNPNSLLPDTRGEIAVPIKLGDEVLGVLDVQSDRVGALSEEDQLLLEGLCGQIASAVESTRLRQDAEERLKQQTILREAFTIFSSTLDQQTVLNHLAEQMVRVLDLTSAYISSYDPDTSKVQTLAEFKSPEAAPEETVSDLGVIYYEDFRNFEKLVEDGYEIYHVDDPDTREEDRQHMLEYGAKTSFDIPLQVEGRFIGYAELWESRQRREFTQGEIALGQSIAMQAAVALENARLYASSQETTARIEELVDERTAELQASETRFRTLFERSGDAYLIVDDYIFVDCNQATVDMLGYTSKEEVLSTHPSDLSPEYQPDGRLSSEKADENTQKAIDQGGHRFEWIHQRANGEDFPVEVLLTKIPLGEREVLFTVWRDITERKMAEQTLRESEQNYQLIFDATPAMFWLKDTQNRILRVNKAAAAFEGVDASDLEGKSCYDLYPQAQAEAFYQDDLAVIRSGKPKLGAIEYYSAAAGGEGRWHENSVLPVRNGEGEIIGTLAFSIDISDRMRLEEQVRESLERRGYQVQVGTQIAQEIAAAPGLEAIFERVVTLVKEQFGYYYTQVLRYEPGLDAVVLVYGYGETGKTMLGSGHQMPLGEGLIGSAAATGITVLRPDLADDPDWEPNPLLPDTRGEIAVPIMLSEKVLGVLDVQSDKVGALSEEDQLLLEGLCGQIASAMESTRLRQETEERLLELNALYRTASREGWQSFHQAGGGRHAYLFDRLDVQQVDDLWAPEIQIAAQQRKLVPPQAADSQNGGDEAATVAPLSARGVIIGALGVYEDPQKPLSEDEVILVEQVSDQVAQALESARLFEQTQGALAQADSMYDISHNVNAATNEDEILQALAQPAVETGALSANLVYLDLDEYGKPEWAEIMARWPQEDKLAVPVGTRFYMPEMPFAKLWISDPNEPQFISDVASDERVDENTRLAMARGGSHSMVIIPLSRGGRQVGLVTINWAEQHEFTNQEIETYRALIGLGSPAVQSLRLLEQTQQTLTSTIALYEGSARIINAATLDEILEGLVTTTELDQLDHASILFFDQPWEVEAPKSLIVASTWEKGGLRSPEIVGTVYAFEQYPLSGLFNRDKPFIVQDLAVDKMLNEESRAVMAEAGIQGGVVFPLRVGGQCFGSISGEAYLAMNLSDSNIRQLSSLVDQAATVIQSLRLRDEMQERLRELTSLQRLMSREAWIAYQDQAGEKQRGYLYDRVNVKPVTDGAGSIEVKQPALTTPLAVRGEPIGVLGVRPEANKVLTAEDQEFLEAISDQVAQAMERARLMEQTQRAAIELQSVADVSVATSTILEPDDLLQSVVNMTKNNFGLYHAHVYLVDEFGKNLLLAAGAGDVGQSMMAEGWSIPIDQEDSFVSQVARTGKGRIIADVRQEAGFMPNSLLPNTLSELAVPMIVGDTLLGVFDVQSNTANRFSEGDVRTFTTLSSQVGVALQNAKLYAEQLETVERLRELDNMKSAFLANMSHELRTPLNSILGFTQVIQEGIDGPLTDLMTSDLDLIEKNGRHLLNLINDVLDMAKIEAGRFSLNLEPLDAYELMEEVIISNAPLAREKDLSMDLEADTTDDWTIMSDHLRMRQIFINVIGNSIKFTDKGGITVKMQKIWALEEGQRDKIQFRVRDTGIGIPPDKLESVFEAFSQVDNSTTRKAGGTGLGLPISRRLVELHGGRLWAESEGIPGKGSVFYLELPYGQDEQVEENIR